MNQCRSLREAIYLDIEVGDKAVLFDSNTHDRLVEEVIKIGEYKGGKIIYTKAENLYGSNVRCVTENEIRVFIKGEK